MTIPCLARRANSSACVSLPFVELQAPHSSCRLSIWSPPPCDRGTMWSIVRLWYGKYIPHPLQYPSWRPNSVCCPSRCIAAPVPSRCVGVCQCGGSRHKVVQYPVPYATAPVQLPWGPGLCRPTSGPDARQQYRPCGAAAEGIQHHIAFVGAGLGNALQKLKWLLCWIAGLFLGGSLQRRNICPHASRTPFCSSR